MSLFQTSVVKKYLNDLSPELIDKKYKEFQSYFGNAERQENIRNSKEEEYQGGFISTLFVNILGYTLNPEPNFNIVLEKKNVDDSKKADGAILKNNEVIAVIELKSTQTTDLDTVETQAFGYKNHNPKCQYIITSNFEKIRLYIQNAIDHIEFDLFNLTKEDFGLLWLCFVKENILQDIPLKIKESSVLQEENVTKQLYNDYSKFRKEIFENIVKNNSEFDKLVLFKKTQKLLDRFLFIFFAEDRLLLPPNSISEIVKQWTTLKEDLDEYVPLYERFKKYFGYLNTGFKGKKYDIFAYNGGLFLPDEILDNIKIEDDVLHQNTVKLSTYDFETEVDVNILGHIFEHSLSEIENLQAEIAGEEIDKQKTKRKKDGIFYTPKYITKYIVENTIGKLCEEKRIEFDIIDEEYAKGRKNRKKDIVRTLDEKLTAYRNWLLEITILDPACGSGAFLNQALAFLIQEHTKIDELKAQLLGGSIVFPDIETKILEKNIFGVDLNEESVEIAKLSLWLRTAQKGRKLTTLSNHIKCGNSLIDEPEIAGEKAFNWQNEFPEVFAKGGFDVVIGNPPYLRVQGLKTHYETESKYLEKRFLCATRRYDIYSLFIEKSFELIKSSGRVSFILPHKFLVVEAGQGIRNFLSKNKVVESIIHFGEEMVFNDATTYTCIITLTQNNRYLQFKHISSFELFDDIKDDQIDYIKLSEDNWNLISNTTTNIIDKISLSNYTVKDAFKNVGAGIDAGADDIFMLTGKVLNNKFVGYSTRLEKDIELEVGIIKPLLKGEDVKRYCIINPHHFIIYPHFFDGQRTSPMEEDYLKSNFPLAYNYLNLFKEEMIARKIRKKTNPKYWYSLHRSRDIRSFDNEKIITPEISLGTNMTLDIHGSYHNTKVYYMVKKESIKEDYKYLLGILNSSLLWFYLKSTGYVLRGGYFTFKTKFLEPFPLPKLENLNQQNPIIEKVEKNILNTKSVSEVIDKFLQYLQSNLSSEFLNKKLQNWFELDYTEFIKEFNNVIKKTNGDKLSKMDEMEWMEVFETKKTEVQLLNSEIIKTNSEIDLLVYELYGLTEEEIKIVENN
jgi:hypothetical protein